jgi:hypothetical protein
VVAYADDVTIFLTDPSDVKAAEHVVTTYMHATGAVIDVQKSTALPVGHWDVTRSIMGIKYRQDVKILGVRFANKIARSSFLSWSIVAPKIKCMTREHYAFGKESYMYTSLSYPNWYTGQVFPIPKSVTRVVSMVMLWYIWQGDIFRLPVSTLHLQPQEGGVGLTDIEVQSQTLFLVRCWRQYKNVGSITADCFEVWADLAETTNPPNLQVIPRKFEYMRLFLGEWTYMLEPQPEENPRTFKRRVYSTLRGLKNGTAELPRMRIMINMASTEWPRIWDNISKPFLPEDVRSTWYCVVHDIIPAQVRLYKIRLQASEKCIKCTQVDTLTHRMTSRGDAAAVWNWARVRVATMVRTEPRNVPASGLTFRNFDISPRPKHNAVLWIIANMVRYTDTSRKMTSYVEYMDYMRQARWKTYRWRKRTVTWESPGCMHGELESSKFIGMVPVGITGQVHRVLLRKPVIMLA